MKSNMTFRLTLLSALIVGVYSQCLAAESTKTSEVTVTASRVEQDLMDVPMSVSVITAEDIKNSSARTVGELLEDVPGVQVMNDGSQGLKRLQIRGEDAFRTVVMIDGQKISEHKSMSGTAILIDPVSIERIEVIKGPASVLYGSDAIGGAINIITKKGAEKPFEADVSVGWNGAGHGWDTSLSLGGKVGGFKYHLDAGYKDHGDIKTPLGYQPNTSFRQKNAGLALSYDLTDKLTVGLNADTFDSDINSSSWDYYQDPDSDFFVKIPKWQRDKIGLFAEGKNLTDYLTKLRWDGYWQKNHKKMQNYVAADPGLLSVVTDSHADNKIKTIGSSLQADWQLGKSNFLITGYEFGEDRLEATTTAASTVTYRIPQLAARNKDTLTNRYVKGKQTTNAIFASMETDLPLDFSLNYGVRYTWVDSKLTRADATQLNRFTGATSPDDSAGRTGSDNNSRPVFNFGVIWKGLEDTSLRATWSQGFRVPILQEKYLINSMGGGTVYGNPDLDPETSNNFELGARYSGEKLKFDLSVFYNDAKDYISQEALDARAGIYQYVNADKAKTRGLELSASIDLFKYFTPYTTLTWMRRKTEWASGVSTYHSGTPSFFARYGLRTEVPVFGGKWNTDTYLRSQTKTKSYSVSTGETTEIAGFTTLNFATAYHFGRHHKYSVHFEFLNITNQLYCYETAIYQPGRHVNFKFNATF